jgi:actin related protein 2/3 complex, subunit 2
MSFLKRHLLAAPFKKVMGAVFNKKGATEVVHIRYRSQTDEAVWIKPSSDSVTIVYSIRFADKSDKILAKVFLSELADARRSMTSVPAVRYSTSEPPMELQGQRDVPEGDDVGFVTLGMFLSLSLSLSRARSLSGAHTMLCNLWYSCTLLSCLMILVLVVIVLFEQHLQPKNMFKTINLAQNFRDYLHYHIKCSKAYMHTRMRERVSTWLQVLNRARPEPFEKKEKKLASGRTFKRK